MDSIKRLDLVDVIRARLIEAGIKNVSASLANLMTEPEATVIRLEAASSKDTYFDLAFDTSVSLNVYLLRVNEIDSMAEARIVEKVLRTSALDSINGSYVLTSAYTQEPRPLTWDESGRVVWAVQVDIRYRGV